MWLLLLNILLPVIGATLWYWGGCGSRCYPGLPPLNKSWRRHAWPAIVGLAILINGFGWLDAAVVTTGLVVANSLGYGESKSWIWRCIVALSLGVPFVWLYPTPIWPLVTLITFIPLYALSLKRNWMTWGVVEATVGAAQGTCALMCVTFVHVFRVVFGV